MPHTKVPGSAAAHASPPVFMTFETPSESTVALAQGSLCPGPASGRTMKTSMLTNRRTEDPTSGNAWENQALFDFEDRALPAMNEFRR